MDFSIGSDASTIIDAGSVTRTCTGLPDANTMVEEQKEKNKSLLLEIAELCKREDREASEVILLLGNPGVGKSSMVNTTIKALTGKYYYRAKAGTGNVGSVTLTFDWFEQCGITKCDIQSLQQEMLGDCWHKLPNIIDAVGMGVEDSQEIREILELILGGFIPPYTNIQDLQELQRTHYVGCLKEIYSSSHEEWKVSRVVFVASCDQKLPTGLIKLLHGILRTSDPKTRFMKYEIDLFVVITKCDLVGSNDEESKRVTVEEFKAIREEIRKEFFIDGVEKHSSMEWRSYVGEHAEDDPFIDKIALKFILQMLQPKRNKYYTKPATLSWMKWIKIYTKTCLKKMREYAKIEVFVLGIAVIMFLIYKTISDPINIPVKGSNEL